MSAAAAQMTTEQRQALEAIAAFTMQRLAAGAPPRRVRTELMDQGIPEDLADKVVSSAVQSGLLDGAGRSARVAPARGGLSAKGLGHIAFGIGIFAIAAIATAASYGAADIGESYTVWTGGFIWGVLQLGYGVIRTLAGD